MEIKEIAGGVCAPKGFLAAGVHCGIRKSRTKKDLALIVSEKRAAAAAVYTQNLVTGAPLAVTKAHLKDGYAQAIICNSGNANTCNPGGEAVAEETCALLQEASGIAAQDVVVASTGVIGQPLDLAPIAAGITPLVQALSSAGSGDASEAILTTDTVKKEIAVEFDVGGKTCRMGGIAKGSGMIHPNMATMLVFVTTDAAISPQMLQQALSEDVKSTFNMISVDGDTSTNDMVAVLANGMAENPAIDGPGEGYEAFCKALNAVTTHLCIAIAKDGEGATKLLTVRVSGGKDQENARKVAKAVACSNLFKAAMFGADANWGRALCAIGYSGAQVDVEAVKLAFCSKAGSVLVCEQGRGVAFSEDLAKQVLSEDEIVVEIGLGDGAAQATAWGCDLTYDYVKINGDYRT